METDFYVLSLRDIKKTPAMCCVVEFEDVLIDQLNAKLISPGHKTDNGGILFIAGIMLDDVIQAIRSINTDDFDGIYAYVFDAFLRDSVINTPHWKRSVSLYFRAVKKIDRVFVPFRQSVELFEKLDIPASYIPLGVDAVKYGGYDDHKIIDVNGYGRQPSELEKILSERFNQRDSIRIYQHTSHAGIAKINDFYAHRRLFWQQLRKSCIALAFDAMHTPLSRNFPFSFVPQRLFESAAAGCVIVGKRPICEEMEELFDWTDATIDLPDDPHDMVDAINYILNEWDLETIGRRNHQQCLSRHDWRLRVNDMMEIMGL
jgi:hypothetical protein